MTDRHEGDGADESEWEPKQPVVPNTWLLADFSDAFSSVSVNQRKIAAKAYQLNGALPVIDQGQAFIGGYTDDESLAVDPGEGLIVFGDHTRIFKRVTFPFAAGADGIKVLRPLLCNSAYAYYACRSLQFPNRGYSRHYSFLTRCKLPIAPEPEQQRIVSKIEELFSRIEEGERALEQVQKLVERYRQSVLKAAVTGELTRDWREKNKGRLESGEALLARILKARREAWEQAELDKMKAKGITPANDKWKQKYEEPATPDITNLPKLPSGWIYVNIDVLVEPVSGSIRRGPFGSTLTKSIFVSSGYKVYEQQHAIGGDFTAGRYYIDEQKYQELSSFWLKPGDLIISCSGTVGRIATVPDDAEPGVMNQALLKLTLAPTVMNGEFFKLAFSHRLASFSSRGSGMSNFSGIEELKKMPFPLPPLNEQREVLQQADRQFSVTGHQELELERQQRMVSSLRQAVLREGFRGALVSQEPTDEPASALLQRITAERVNAPVKFKRGRKPKTPDFE